MTKGIFYGVGVGPGDPGLLTLKAAETIGRCAVIAAPETAGGGMLALDIAKQAVNLAGKEILPLRFAMSRNKELLHKSHNDAAAQIAEKLCQGKDVAMLNLGDVSIYSTFSYMRELLCEQGFETVMIPGVPSFCAVAATLQTSLTQQMDSPLHIIPAGFQNLAEALHYPGTKVIMKAGKPLAEVKETLRREGVYQKASLVQNCTLPNQRVAHSLEEAEENGGYFTTLVVQP